MTARTVAQSLGCNKTPRKYNRFEQSATLVQCLPAILHLVAAYINAINGAYCPDIAGVIWSVQLSRHGLAVRHS